MFVDEYVSCQNNLDQHVNILNGKYATTYDSFKRLLRKSIFMHPHSFIVQQDQM